MIGRISDDAVRASVAPTLRAAYAELGTDWSRQVLAQLIAVVEHIERRGPDPTPQRRAALATALEELEGNSLVPAAGSPELRAAAALAAAVARDDADADTVRRVLRQPLAAELDAELAVTMELMEGFRGRVRDA